MQKIKAVSEVANVKRSAFFPLKINKNITCDIATEDEISAFTKKSYNKVFKTGFKSVVKIQQGSKAQKGILSTNKEYDKIHQEYFLFKYNEKVIGWTYGEMEDFETFYMRSSGILPEYQRMGIYSNFLTCFLAYMKELGYQRVSSQHATWDTNILACKMKEGFIITALENHDRWGALVKLVKHLSPEREKKYKITF